MPRTPTGGVAELAQASLLVQNLLSPLTARQSLPAAERSQLGPCFICGKMGHLRRACMPSVARVVVLKDPLDCVLTYIALSTVYVVSGVLNNVLIIINSVLSHPTCNYL